MNIQSLEKIIKDIAEKGILDAVGDSISIQDRNFRVLYQNRLHKEGLGDHAGEYCYRAYQNRDSVCGGCHLVMSFRDGNVHTAEQTRTTDTGVRYYEISASPLRNLAGEIIAGVELVRDVTDRKSAEVSLRKKSRQLADSQKVALLGSWEWDIANNVITWSDELYRMFGVNPDTFQATYEAFLEMVHPEDRTRFDNAVQSSIQNRQPHLVEVRIIHPDGAEWTMEARGKVRYDDSGSPVMMGGTAQNITERKKAENELMERIHLAELNADVGSAFTKGGALSDILRRCTRALVSHLDASFARIWTFNEQENVLELQASSGLYSHTNGTHSRVQPGRYKIGMIARDRKPHLTNHVMGDPMIHDQEWARRERIVSFAGHPLILEDRLVGVMAMFSRNPLTEIVMKALSSVADEMAIGIEHKRAEQDLLGHRQHLEELVALRTEEIIQANKSLRQEIAERRRLEKALLEIEDRERQHIGHELHDSLGQLLTGIAFKNKSLQNDLNNRMAPEAEDAAHIGSLINEAKLQTKILSRGLSPVGTDGAGLMSALESLGVNALRLFHVPCTFICDEPVLLRHEKAILQLYRIAQEAVTNAVRHSQCKTITIELERAGDVVIITISDDGIGMKGSTAAKDGMGLKIMHYRAGMIGADLDVLTNDGTGTVIRCAFPDSSEDDANLL